MAIWLNGSDLCKNKDGCVRSQSSVLGSSKYWPPTIEGLAIQSQNKTENPDLWDWKVVYLEYCSAGVWSGMQVEPTNLWQTGPDNL